MATPSTSARASAVMRRMLKGGPIVRSITAGEGLCEWEVSRVFDRTPQGNVGVETIDGDHRYISGAKAQALGIT